MESIGIKNNLLLWFSDYLKHRRQRVVINGVSSSWEEINAGVPQGSILGPLLFLIYINDIVNDIETNIRLFADDTSLYIIVENPQSSADFLNNDLEKIHNWSNAWLVDFNPNKTESLIISRKHNPPFRPTLYMDNTPIREVESHKHLGLTFDSNGTWDAHIETIITKASKRIGLLRKIKFKIDRFSLQKIYFSFIRPILEYADIIWDGCNQTMKARLERIHFEAARIITGASKLASIESLLTETGWDTLQNRRYKHKLILFHKMFHKQTPDYLASLVPFSAHEIHGRNTRNQHQLVNINCRTESYRNSFLPSVIKAWNDLPVDIRNNPSLWSLKNFINRNLSKNPTYFNCGSRIGQIYHARLRTNSGPLNDHLYKCNLSDSMACKTLQYSIIWICVCDISICVCNIWICVCNISICVCNIWICVCNISICVCNISICVCNISICVCNISICVCNFFDMCVQLFRYVWNAKSTETQIFSELCIEIESSLIQL